MIQRIQTIYILLIILIISSLLIISPTIAQGIGLLNNQKNKFELSIQKTTVESLPSSETYNYGIIISLISCVILSVSSIFLFKTLHLQKRILKVNYLVILSSGIFIFYTLYNIMQSFTEIMEIQYSVYFIAPILLLLINFLAIRGINKDIDTLASADRLR